MALKHLFTSAKSDGGDATQVQPSNWNDDHLVDASGMKVTTTVTPPSAAASGFMTFFGKLLAGSAMLAGVGPTGAPMVAQPFFGQKRIQMWMPLPNSTSTGGSVFGMAAMSGLGTATARTVAVTNFFTQSTRIGYVSAATAASRALAYSGVATSWRGNGAGLGGFRAVFRFGASDAATVATANTFVGMATSSAIGAGSTEPSVSLNIFGVGADSTDTNLSIMTNDGSGTATKSTLGSSFPAHTLSTDVYELALYCPPNASSIGWQVTRLNTGDVASGTVTTDLPASNTLLQPVFMRGNMGTALAVGIDILGLYTESET